MRVSLGVTEDISINVDIPSTVHIDVFLQIADEVQQLTTGHKVLKSHDEHAKREAHNDVLERIEKYHREFEAAMKKHDMPAKERLARLEEQTGYIIALLQMLAEEEEQSF